MFKEHDQDEHPAVQGEEGGQLGATTPRPSPVFAESSAPAGEPVPEFRAEPLRRRLAWWRRHVEAHCARIDLAPDLAEEIGSRRWFRGLGTLLGLGLAALSFWPDFTTVEAATGMPIDDATRDEFRSQMIMPLALGSDSGRRMGATAAVAPLTSVPERPRVSFTTTLGRGDSFERMLHRVGVGTEEAAEVLRLVADVMSPSEISSGTQVDLTLGRRPMPGSPRPLDALQFRARFDLDLAIARRGGRLALEQRPISVDTTPLRITGRVGSSLYRSARAAGAPMKAIQQYLRAIDQHLGLDGEIAPTDEFDLIVGYKRSARGENAVGELLYAGLERDGRPSAQLLRWGGEGQFFEASGVGRRTEMARFAPVAGRVTSHFGMRRHPILGYRRMHGGVDFGARWGAPVFAASSGTVSFAGRHGGHGNFVRLDHGGGLGTGYAHMSRIAVSAGTQVRAGQVIGYVGSTGLSTGPHLHFEAYRNGRIINPLSVRFVAHAAVDEKDLSAFKARLAELRAVAPGAALASLAPKQAAVSGPAREIDRLAQ